MAMCLTQQFPLERIMVDEGLWGVAMGREVWDGIKKHTVELTKEQLCMTPSPPNPPYDLFQEMESL